jgi:hypothetical protein
MGIHSVGAFVLCASAAAAARPGLVASVIFDGGSENDSFGGSVSGAGDVDGDGFDDLIVGAILDDHNGFGSGSARVISGATGATLYTFHGDSVEDLFGFSVAGAGDVNGDGFADLIVGALWDDIGGHHNSGSARIFSGATGAILYTFFSDSAGDEFGNAVSGAGDVNSDGFDDVIIGAFADDNSGMDSGSAKVFSGATGALLYTFNGGAASDYFGVAVSGAGDVNDDGFADLIVGAPHDAEVGSVAGYARVFSGATGEILCTFHGSAPDDFFGGSVSGAGDVNGDGFDDVIVGARNDIHNGSNTGSARVFSGATGGILYAFYGDSAGNFFGASVRGAGDVNGDGVDDLLAGAPHYGSNGAAPGYARVFSGADGEVLFTFNGESAYDYFGDSVSGAGDVNGDGLADLVIGVSGDDTNGTNSGSARLFFSFGVPTPPKPCPGDADGDGDSDFADLNQVISNFNTSCAP